MVGPELDDALLQSLIVGNLVFRSLVGDNHTHQLIVLVLGEVGGNVEAEGGPPFQLDMVVAVAGHSYWGDDGVVPHPFQLGYPLVAHWGKFQVFVAFRHLQLEAVAFEDHGGKVF